MTKRYRDALESIENRTNKLRSTLRILVCLGMARTFGEYICTKGMLGEPDIAVYWWRGKKWHIPIGPVGE